MSKSPENTITLMQNGYEFDLDEGTIIIGSKVCSFDDPQLPLSLRRFFQQLLAGEIQPLPTPHQKIQ